MPYVPTEKQCAFCGRTWMAARPKSRTCSPKCRASLIAAENGTARPKLAPMPGFDFLDDDDYVTTPELAAVLGTHRQRIGDLIREGKLPARPRAEGRGLPYLIRVGDARNAFPQLREAVKSDVA